MCLVLDLGEQDYILVQIDIHPDKDLVNMLTILLSFRDYCMFQQTKELLLTLKCK